MTELKAFIAMLTRAGIGHGLRHDYDPNGTAVQVEHEDDEQNNSEWWFNEDGQLVTTHVYESEGT